MKNVVSLDDHRPHKAQYVACMDCGKDWVAVFPATAQRLECPSCRAMAGEPVQIHDPDWIGRFMREPNIKQRTMVCINAKHMEQTR